MSMLTSSRMTLVASASRGLRHETRSYPTSRDLATAFYVALSQIGECRHAVREGIETKFFLGADPEVIGAYVEHILKGGSEPLLSDSLASPIGSPPRRDWSW